MLSRMKIGIGALVAAGAGILWASAPFAGNNGGSSTVTPRPVAYATEERVQNAWPVGEEWRYKASWASPQALYAQQYDLWQRGIATCMKDEGFDYAPYTYFESDAVFSQLNPLYQAGLALGYAEPRQPDPEADSPNAQQPQEFQDALLGEQGCVDRSSALIFSAPAASAFADMQGTLIASVDRTIGGYVITPDAQQRNASWSSCMTSRSLDFDAPADAAREFSDDGVVSGQEVRVRSADYECDLASGLTESRSRWETAAFSTWLNDNATGVSQLEDLQTRAESEAASLSATLTEQGVAALPNIEGAGGETTASTVPN
jgi:hypothetical protein